MLEVVRELENISSMLPKADAINIESDGSNLGTSNFVALPLLTRSNTDTSTDYLGSDLVSGVMPQLGLVDAAQLTLFARFD